MDNFLKIASIGLGGAFGAIFRHLINISPLAGLFGKFPTATFVINVGGSFLMGLLVVLLLEKFEVSDYAQAAVLIGFLGAFTTFSTFELELVNLSEGRSFAIAALYLTLSVVAGFAALFSGMWLARKF